MNFEDLILGVENQAQQMVWWSPDQIARGEDLINDPKKGERPWSVPRKTGKFLFDKILELKPKVILELGTSIGYSTLWIARGAEKIGAHVFTIEQSPHKFKIAQENILRAELEKNVTFYLGEIIDVIKNHDFLKNKKDKKDGHDDSEIKIDFLFLDADRGHYHEYFPLLEKYFSEHATIIADNAGNMNARMQPFLDLLEQKNWKFKILDFDNGILVARK